MPQQLKTDGTRQRRNKATTRATLTTPEPNEILIPQLPAYPTEGEYWDDLTLLWWDSVWSSPMASQYLPSDFFGLLRLAYLNDKFWKHPSTTTASELRLLERDFGLSPLNRKRLEWTANQADDSAEQLEARRSKRAKIIPAGDPRKALT